MEMTQGSCALLRSDWSHQTTVLFRGELRKVIKKRVLEDQVLILVVLPESAQKTLRCHVCLNCPDFPTFLVFPC